MINWSGLVYKMLLDRTFCLCDEMCHGGKHVKDRLMAAVCCNMSGTETWPCLVNNNLSCCFAEFTLCRRRTVHNLFIKFQFYHSGWTLWQLLLISTPFNVTKILAVSQMWYKTGWTVCIIHGLGSIYTISVQMDRMSTNASLMSEMKQVSVRSWAYKVQCQAFDV